MGVFCTWERVKSPTTGLLICEQLQWWCAVQSPKSSQQPTCPQLGSAGVRGGGDDNNYDDD